MDTRRFIWSLPLRLCFAEQNTYVFFFVQYNDNGIYPFRTAHNVMFWKSSERDYPCRFDAVKGRSGLMNGLFTDPFLDISLQRHTVQSSRSTAYSALIMRFPAGVFENMCDVPNESSLWTNWSHRK